MVNPFLIGDFLLVDIKATLLGLRGVKDFLSGVFLNGIFSAFFLTGVTFDLIGSESFFDGSIFVFSTLAGMFRLSVL